MPVQNCMVYAAPLATVNDARSKLTGVVEVDETIVGGPVKGQRGRGVTAAPTKTLAFGAVQMVGYIDKHGQATERAGRIRLCITGRADEKSIERFLDQNVDGGSMIRTDGWKGYSKTALSNYHHGESSEIRATTHIHRFSAISRPGSMVRIMGLIRNTYRLISTNLHFDSIAEKHPWPLFKHFWGSLLKKPHKH
nr:transposase [Pontiella sulfatireligans]